MKRTFNKEALLNKYNASWEELCKSGALFPIADMDAVSIRQVAEYLGVSVKDLQVPRQRLKKDLDALGMFTLAAREVGAAVHGATRHPDGSYDLPLEGGGVTSIPCGRYTYLRAPAVKRLMDGLSCSTKENVQDTAEANMPAVDVQTFCGVRGYVDKDGVAQLNLEDVVFGLGFTQNKGGTEYVRWDRIQSYLESFEISPQVGKDGNPMLHKDCELPKFIPEPIFYLLAMKADNETACAFQHTIAYDVLPAIRRHGAYLTPKTIEEVLADPDTIIRIATELKEERARRKDLESANADLTLTNAMLSKEEQKWAPSEVVSRLVRLYSSVVFGNDFRLGWADFHHELQYRMNINLKMRAGNTSLIKRIRNDEWGDVIAIAAAMCQANGIDPAKAINQTNTDIYLEKVAC